jgi:hypothetical protein
MLDNPTQPSALKPFAVTIADARPLLGNKARSEIYEAINRGQLVALKDGRRTLLTTESIEAYMAALPRATFKPLGLPRPGRKRRHSRKRA